MLNNVTTRTKLMFFPVLFIVNIIVAGFLFSYFNGKVKHTAQAELETEIFIQDVLKGRISVYQFLRNPNDNTAQKVREDFKKLDDEVKALKGTLEVPENKKLCDDILGLSSDYIALFDNFSQKRIDELKLGIEKESSEVSAIVKKMAQTGLVLEDKLLVINKNAIALKNEADTNLNRALLVLAIFSAIVFVVFSIALSSMIVNTLNHFKDGLLSFFAFLNKESDNVKSLEANGKDEFAQMAKVVNENITKINEGLKKDNEAVKEALLIVEKAKLGYLNLQLTAKPNNPQLVQLSEALNSMIKNIKGNVDSISVVLKEFSNYKFTSKVDNKGMQGDMAALIDSVNFLTDEISGLLKQSLTIGLTLDEASDQLIINVDKLNTSANEAAASLEETAAALEEITSTIVNNSENVSKMSSYAQELSSSARNGQSLASKTTVAMDEINTQVTAINEAITVIDQIAFQTNILSLNAAVEAATAGEAGKGFAVVAQEVRNLASRSAEAAKEIKELVENATSKANEGKNISAEMISGYDKLLENIDKSTQMISEIASASKEQEAGITQINDAVTQLDQQTQQNAAIATQTHDIAVQTDTIAKEIVSDANAKEFLGKKEAKVEKVQTKKYEEPKAKYEASYEKDIYIDDKPKKQEVFVSKTKDDDEWESF
ncbi:chemotaxis protein [Malaciobacter mytili]|uniref:methyl-accepting chemotaxis protein n=1 Tax=Malaciobacter mytili TaxID=603050 RepID=UPI00100B3F97|nr:methyl-accepting chemotaxis protein [Malaciobacter mytili]RXI44845.1 chemotaxis protein [Malaciobacter mytili]